MHIHVCNPHCTLLTSLPVGNRRFRVLCEVGAEKYRQSSNKIERSTIVYGIVESIKEADGGGFVRWVSKIQSTFVVCT